MAPVSLRYVVSFSSQDEKNPVENILSGDQTRRWLSPPREKLGRLEAEFQLERSCAISHLDIGTIWTFSVQISVGRSSWPRGREYVTLLPSATFMNPLECKQAQKGSGFKLRMFKKDDFSQEALGEKYDRLKICLTQPFRKDFQFGLCFLKVVSDDCVSPSAAPSTERLPSGESQKKRAKNSRSQGQGDGDTNVTTSSDIKKHFFGNKSENVSPADPLKAKLLKLSRSGMDADSPDGPQPSSALSRNARLVMAAKGKAPVFKSPIATGSGSDQDPGQITCSTTSSNLSAMKRKLLPSIKDEIKDFLYKVDTKRLDLETFTFADLRHKFEKVKCRKLSKEERKKFFPMAKEFIQRAFEENEDKDNATEAPSQSTNDSSQTTAYPWLKKSAVNGHNQNNLHSTTPIRKQNTHLSTTGEGSKPATEGGRLGQDVYNTTQTLKQNTHLGTTKGERHQASEVHRGGVNTYNTTRALKQNTLANTTGGESKPTKKEFVFKNNVKDYKSNLPDKFKLTPGKSFKNGSVHQNTEDHINDFRDVCAAVAKLNSVPHSKFPGNQKTVGANNYSTKNESNQGILTTPGKMPVPPRPDTCGVWLNKGTPPPPQPIQRQPSSPEMRRPSPVSGPGRGAGRGRGNVVVPPGEARQRGVVTEISSSNTGGGFIRASGSNHASSTAATVPCPLCNGRFPIQTIETHAATCGIVVSSDSDTDDGGYYYDNPSPAPQNNYSNNTMPTQLEDVTLGQCPMCSNFYPLSELPTHADNCAWAGFM